MEVVDHALSVTLELAASYLHLVHMHALVSFLFSFLFFCFVFAFVLFSFFNNNNKNKTKKQLSENLPFNCFFDRTGAVDAMTGSMTWPTTALTVDFWTQSSPILGTNDFVLLDYRADASPTTVSFQIRYSTTTGISMFVFVFVFFVCFFLFLLLSRK